MPICVEQITMLRHQAADSANRGHKNARLASQVYFPGQCAQAEQGLQWQIVDNIWQLAWLVDYGRYDKGRT